MKRAVGFGVATILAVVTSQAQAFIATPSSIGIGLSATKQGPHSQLILHLLSLEWWIEVVVAGIAVNLIAQTLHNRLGSWSLSARSKRRLVAEAKRTERSRLVDQLRQDKHKELRLYSEMIHDRIEAVALLLGMSTSFLLGLLLSRPVFLVIMMFCAGAISGLRSIMMLLQADRKRSLLHEAQAGNESSEPLG